MNHPMFKKVFLPLEVPDTEYCWMHTAPYTICPHFDNEGGHPHCTLTNHIRPLNFEITEAQITGTGIVKPPDCANLLNVDNVMEVEI